jgi:hypothetical protein
MVDSIRATPTNTEEDIRDMLGGRIDDSAVPLTCSVLAATTAH